MNTRPDEFKTDAAFLAVANSTRHIQFIAVGVVAPALVIGRGESLP